MYISIYNMEVRDNIRCIWNHYVRGLEVPALQYCRSHREPPLNTSERERQWLPETMQELVRESAAMESLYHSTLPSTSTQLPPLPPATANQHVWAALAKRDPTAWEALASPGFRVKVNLCFLGKLGHVQRRLPTISHNVKV